MGFTGFFQVIPKFPPFTRRFFPLVTGFYRVFLGFSGFYQVVRGFYRVLKGFTGFRMFFQVLLAFTEFYSVITGFTGFYWVLPNFFRH